MTLFLSFSVIIKWKHTTTKKFIKNLLFLFGFKVMIVHYVVVVYFREDSSILKNRKNKKRKISSILIKLNYDCAFVYFTVWVVVVVA